MESLLPPETVTKPPQVTSPAPQAKLPEEEAGDRRLSRLGTWQPEQEQLPCPRCHSTNTKFCYFNNYSLSQPRHFCKSCRRYWTRGGALRNVPVGRGTRKASSSNKRLRIATSSTTAVSSNGNSLAASGKDIDVVGQTQTTDPLVPNSLSGLDSGSSLNASAKTPVAKSEGLSWWSGQMGGVEVDLLPVNGDVLGLGPGMGFEPGVLDWTMELGSGGDGDALVDLTGDSLGCNVEVGRRR